jgi:site-specific recombinase XerD
MKGREPFTKEQQQKILNTFSGTHKIRNQTILVLGCLTGFRISEMLSLRIKDIYVEGVILDHAYIKKANVKKQTEGKSIPLNNFAKDTLLKLVNDLHDSGYTSKDSPIFVNKRGYKPPANKEIAPRINSQAMEKLLAKIKDLNTKLIPIKTNNMEGSSVPLNDFAKSVLSRLIHDLHRRGLKDDDVPIFISQKGEVKAIAPSTAWRVIKNAAFKCGVYGAIGTHSMRKTFAKAMNDYYGGDLVKVQQAMRHKKIDSTASYIQFDQKEINDGILNLDYELTL